MVHRSSFEYMPWYAGKAEIREYLKTINGNAKVGHGDLAIDKRKNVR